MNPDLQALITSLEHNLNEIQSLFQKYQDNNFIKRTPEFFCLELNGEAGELANIEKKQWKGQDISQAQFNDESADVFIALMNYVNSRNINLKSAVIEKLIKIDKIRIEKKAESKEY